MSFIVREARTADERAVERVLERSYPSLMSTAYETELLALAIPMMTRANLTLLASGNFHVAEAGGEVVGCGGWSFEKPGSSDRAADVGHVRHFATDPEYTRKGVGRAIYDCCESQARAAGLKRLECFASLNSEAFYRALGFNRVGIIELRMTTDVMLPSIHMVRAI